MKKLLLTLFLSVVIFTSFAQNNAGTTVGHIENSVNNVRSIFKAVKKNKNSDGTNSNAKENGKEEVTTGEKRKEAETNKRAYHAFTKDKEYFIPPDEILFHYLAGTYTNLKNGKTGRFNIDSLDEIVTTYISQFKGIDVNRYDEFDKRKVLKVYKDSLKVAVKNADFEKVYMTQTKVSYVEKYDFEKKRFPCSLTYDLSEGGLVSADDISRPEISCADKPYNLKIVYLNVQAGTEGVYLYLDEGKAEQFRKKLDEEGVHGMAIVKHLKFLPGSFISASYRYQTAKLLRLEFYYVVKDAKGTYSLGEKITEMEWAEKIYPHLNLN